MKKYSVVLAVIVALGLFAVHVADVGAEVPPALPNLSGCGQTLTPFGTFNQTIRCDGRNWVAAGNFLNDGVNVGIGSLPTVDSQLNVVKSGSGGIAIQGTSGDSGIGVTGSGLIGVSGSNTSAASSSVGVRGLGATGVSGQSNFAVGGVAVKAASGLGQYGFYQEGSGARNYFQGSLGLGVPLDPVAKLSVVGGVRIMSNQSTPMPVCAAAARGVFWFTPGDAGVADTAQVCAKTATSTYAWRNLF